MEAEKRSFRGGGRMAPSVSSMASSTLFVKAKSGGRAAAVPGISDEAAAAEGAAVAASGASSSEVV